MSATLDEIAFTLPEVPVSHKDFVSYINKNSGKEISSLVGPYNEYEAKLREGFAQHRDHKAIQDPHVNAVPVFGVANDVLRIQRRNFDDESLDEKYIMPLSTSARKSDGAPAMVESMQDFRKNFNLFSESSLVDLDWSNVVAAGSAVVTPLLPVPKKHGTSKKAQREYYHEQLAPSSDVDLFIWGLDEAEAIEKIKQIESSVRNAILEEVTTVRTKNAITIASRYPVRHVQIVLRLYKSVSEILSGFDVDCSCFAYDGQQIYGTPRGITAFVTQVNTIDLSRRSPSYESRLSKYAHRGFEIYCPDLDRSRVDPTIFERSFARTVGLARLLVLEQLPKPSDREMYLDQRREERGRPASDRGYWNRSGLPDNLKERDPDDVAEWVYDDEVANYHSFTVPYGPKYHAKKIEKLLYTKDLLLNAEWNHKKDRAVNLHRHPCYMGPIESVIHDCCGSCPEPKTEEEREVAQEECKIYISGDLKFMEDDPGRQTIGSFNPLTKDDWTDMAYIGNTEELCQRICDGDLHFVQGWCQNNANSIDRRDHTGRTPLHVATQSSTPEIVKCLVDHDARIVARLVDGMTALHLAALRGSVEIVSILLEKSEENEAREDDKHDGKRASKQDDEESSDMDVDADDENEDENMEDDMDDDDSNEDMATTEGSFVNIVKKKPADEDALDNEDDSEPDVYDVNVVAWDSAVSPMHLAILGGHVEVIKVLASTFGADVLLPVKLVNSYTRKPSEAIMTLVLAAQLSGALSVDVTKTLLSLGASSAQADMTRVSAFHYLTAKANVNVLKACIDDDTIAARSVLDHVGLQGSYYDPSATTPLTTAINAGKKGVVNVLLDAGAKPIVDVEDFANAYSAEKEANPGRFWRSDENLSKMWRENVNQPILLAVEREMPEFILRMIDSGADINTVDTMGHTAVGQFEEDSNSRLRGKSLLDLINSKLLEIEKAIESQPKLPKPIDIADDQAYLGSLATNSYEAWSVCKTVEVARNIVKEWADERTKQLAEESAKSGRSRRLAILKALKDEFDSLRSQILERGAKTLDEMNPDMVRDPQEHGVARQDQTKGKLFEPKVGFKTSCTDTVRDGYLQLFEAAWIGDVPKIKELTLTSWGSDQKQNPLSVATQDSKGFTSLAIAIYRRHFDVAKILLEIADLQYRAPEKDPELRRYRINEEDSDIDSEEGDNDIAISSEVVDETYTIDNIASLQRSVGSKSSASDVLSMHSEIWCLLDQPEKDAWRMLRGKTRAPSIYEGRHRSDVLRDSLDWRSPATHTLCRYALARRDINLLRFWLQLGQDASKMKGNKDGSYHIGLDGTDVDFAIGHGLFEEASEIIKVTGAKLPLDALLKHSGFAEEQKPRYYQGLQIGGKHMKGWAREHGGSTGGDSLSLRISPLLNAANQGSLVAVEWYLSDTPFRLYKEYGAANAKEPLIQSLSKAHGGFDQTVSAWLKQRSNLALHGAVLSETKRKASLEIIKYLVNVFPTSLNLVASKSGLTPLALAFLTGRVDAAKALIEAGADQTTRDFQGKNLIHLALLHISENSPPSVEKLKALFSLVDRRLLPSLFIERCRDAPTALTPLAYWLANARGYHYRGYVSRDNSKVDSKILDVFYSFGGSPSLEVMDGSGQFPIHHAVKYSHVDMIKNMLVLDPSLLTRENAMGQTAMELAESLYVRDCMRGNPSIRASNFRSVTKKQVEDFAPMVHKDGTEDTDEILGVANETTDDEDEAIPSNVRRTYRICRDIASRNPGLKRKLVSVIEAREVAKRLADKTNEKRKEEEKKGGEDESEEDQEQEKEGQDEVDWWLKEMHIVKL